MNYNNREKDRIVKLLNDIFKPYAVSAGVHLELANDKYFEEIIGTVSSSCDSKHFDFIWEYIDDISRIIGSIKECIDLVNVERELEGYI